MIQGFLAVRNLHSRLNQDAGFPCLTLQVIHLTPVMSVYLFPHASKFPHISQGSQDLVFTIKQGGHTLSHAVSNLSLN